MNITMPALIERLEFGLRRLKDENLSVKEQGDILRAIASIARMRHEQIETQLKETV